MATNKNIGSKTFFTAALMLWNKLSNEREMPWKNEKDPYKVWISEIILQQTRVEQGTEYYKRFINAYPSVRHIAGADENHIFKLWEGLGYYSRCKNIIASAKHIANELNGNFPDNYEDILKLKGVGTYTASAIASFVYNQPHAVLDGNVFRVLSRFFGMLNAIDGKDKSIYSALAYEVLDKKTPGIYNQAIMDFGATICKPKLPLCTACPLHTNCFAFLNGMINTLPVKEKKIVKRTRWLYYLLVEYKNEVYVRKRLGKDIWQNLNEFVLIETKEPVSIIDLQSLQPFKNIFDTYSYTLKAVSKIYMQQLTHQIIKGQFFKIQVTKKINIEGYQAIPFQELQMLPFPKIITAYLKD